MDIFIIIESSFYLMAILLKWPIYRLRWRAQLDKLEHEQEKRF